MSDNDNIIDLGKNSSSARPAEPEPPIRTYTFSLYDGETFNGRGVIYLSQAGIGLTTGDGILTFMTTLDNLRTVIADEEERAA